MITYINTINDILEKVAGADRTRAPVGDDLGKDVHHLLARLVALLVLLRGRARPQGRERGETAVERMVDARNLGREILADLGAHETRRGGHDDELREDLPDLDFALVAPLAEVPK